MPSYIYYRVVVVDDDSRIQLVVLVTEETRVTQHVRLRPINATPDRGHIEVPRSTDHVVETTARYSNQQGFTSRQNPCQPQPTENIGNLSASRRCLWERTTVSTVWSAASISESEFTEPLRNNTVGPQKQQSSQDKGKKCCFSED